MWTTLTHLSIESIPWASCQIRKIEGCTCAGNTGDVSPSPRFSDPDMHHGTCVNHVPWCMPGSLNSGFLWSRWRGKRCRDSRRKRNSQFYVSGKRAMTVYCLLMKGFNSHGIVLNIWIATNNPVSAPERQTSNHYLLTGQFDVYIYHILIYVPYSKRSRWQSPV